MRDRSGIAANGDSLIKQTIFDIYICISIKYNDNERLHPYSLSLLIFMSPVTIFTNKCGVSE